MNISAPFIARPVATTLLTIGIALAGDLCVLQASGLAAAASGFPDYLSAGDVAGRQPGNRCVHCRRAAGTPPRPDCRSDRDDIHQFGGVSSGRAAVRPGSRHQWRGARCAGGDQRRPGGPADYPAQQSDVLEGQSGGCANRDPDTDLTHADGWAALRRRGDRAVANTVADQRRRPGDRWWRGASSGTCGVESDRAVQIRHRVGRCAGCPGVSECQQSEGLHRHGGAALSALYQ